MKTITDPSGRPWPIDEVKNCVGPGWSALVDRLITRLFELGWDGNLMQVKEKFGGLRFYIGSADQAVFDAIDAAEAESFRTCEGCGADGELRDGGWIRTLCNACDAAREK